MTSHSLHGGPRAARWLLPALALFLLAGVAAAGKGKAAFEVYKDKAGEYRWRFKAANSKIIAVARDGYKNHSDAKTAVSNIQKNVAKMKVEYYQDKGKEWRWRLKASNGVEMARSSEGYDTKAGAERGFEVLAKGAKSAKVADEKK